jgi:putative ABC transport system substrate-binding protein
MRLRRCERSLDRDIDPQRSIKGRLSGGLSRGEGMAGVARREFLIAIGALLAAPLTIEAQQPGKVPRIGYFAQNSAELGQRTLAAFRQGLRERGWVEGRNVIVEIRFADGRVDRFPALIAELIRLGVDVIVTTSSATTWAAKDATKTIPIVMAASADAPGEGLVASLAHPGGNITGMTFLAGPEIAGKQLQLLHEVAPAASRVAVLANPTNRSHAAFVGELKTAARSLRAQLQVIEVPSPDQVDSAFAAIPKEQAAALLVLTDSMFLSQQRRIADLAARSRLPALYSQREFVEAGGLISYGPSLRDMFRRAAIHVDKILRGGKPDGIPVEQPTNFELLINLTTAKALGLTIPPSLLLRADEVIQ